MVESAPVPRVLLDFFVFGKLVLAFFCVWTFGSRFFWFGNLEHPLVPAKLAIKKKNQPQEE